MKAIDNLSLLKSLTEELPLITDVSDLISFKSSTESAVVYKSGDKTSLGLGLLNKDEISVQDVFMPKGAEFPSHIHPDSVEILVVYSGSIEVESETNKILLEKGGSLRLDKETVHSVNVLEDTKLIAIGVPRIKGFPKS